MTPAPLTPQQAKIVGRWKLYRSENFDAYMRKIGVGMIQRAFGNRAKPVVDIAYDDSAEAWNVAAELPHKTVKWKFKNGEGSPQPTIDGRIFQTTAVLEDNDLVEIQEICPQSPSGAVPSVIRRSVNESDELVAQCTAGDVVATRYFKRI